MAGFPGQGRSATRFLATGRGKAATVAVLALVAAGVAAGIVVSRGDGDLRPYSAVATATRIVLPPQPEASPDPSPSLGGPSPRTVIMVGDRDLAEVLDEASYRAGFVVSLPSWLPDGFRAHEIIVSGPNPADMRSVYIYLRREGEPGTMTFSLNVLDVDILWHEDGAELKTGRRGVRAWQFAPPGRRPPSSGPFVAVGGGQFVTLWVPQLLRDAPPPAIVSEDDALRMLTSFFDVSPVLKAYDYPGGTAVASPPVPTSTPDTPDHVTFYAETAGYNIKSVLRAASGVAGFEAVLPRWLPGGWQVIAISASGQRNNDPPIVNIHLAGPGNGIVILSQWVRESLAPPSSFGLGVEVDFPGAGVEAVRFGEDGQRPFYFASGPDHTALIYDALPAIGEEDALRILASIFEPAN